MLIPHGVFQSTCGDEERPGFWWVGGWQIRCFLLCHPGKDVTRKSYNGDVGKIEPLFRRLLDAYAREIFARELEVSQAVGQLVNQSVNRLGTQACPSGERS
jgi:hypothetical protein